MVVYTCGHCGKAISKSTRTCPHCRVSLSGIKCQACSYVGDESDFADDRCPRCGTQVVRPATAKGQFSWPYLTVVGAAIVIALVYYFGGF